MKEGAKISPSISAVVGTVQIDYVDPITGKVKAQIKEKNHVWEDTFTCSFWNSFLNFRFGDNSNRLAQLFLTDSDAAVTDNIPYQQGNIIGWGIQGMGADGIRQGSWNSTNSTLGTHILNGNGIQYRHAFDFTMTQVPETIGSVAFTPQYRPRVPIMNTGTHGINRIPHAFRPLRERRLSTWGGGGTNAVSSVMRNNTRYWVTQTGTAASATVTVHRMNMLTGETVQINITDVTSNMPPAAVMNRSIGAAFDSDRMYVMSNSATAAACRIWEFTDDTFDIGTVTPYDRPAFTQQPWYGCFAVFDGTLYSPGETMLRVYDPVFSAGVSGSPGIYSEVLNNNFCPYNTAQATSPSFITMRGGILYRLAFQPVNGRAPFWNLNGALPEQIGTLGTINVSAGGAINTCGIMTEPAIDNRMILFATHSDTGGQMAGGGLMDFWTNQGVCCFAIPDGADPRPPNTGIMVSYNLDIMY